jgi:hypothetical protein
MNGIRYVASAALLAMACSYSVLGQVIANNEPLPDAPSTMLQALGAQGTSSVHGVVTDTPGDIIPDTRVTLEVPGKLEPRTTITASDGSFSFTNLPAGRYRLMVSGPNLETYVSGEFTVKPGETFEVPRLALKIVTSTTVDVTATSEQVAQEQVSEQEKQRVFGVVQNFYTSYI